MREVFADRQGGRGEDPGGPRTLGHRGETRCDVERQQAHREAPLRDLDAARALVFLGVDHGIESCSEFAGARRALRDARFAAVFVERRGEIAQRARHVLRGIRERRVGSQPVGPRRIAQDVGQRRQRFLDGADFHRQSRSTGARDCTSSWRASRSSSSTWRLPRRVPKNCVARSGIWCASSRMTASAEPSRSPKPSSLSARSASSRWWLTMTMSASMALRRASTTWHLPMSAQRAPRQLSRVEVICGHRGCASPRSGTSARSPVFVVPAQRSTRASVRSRVPARLFWPPSCFSR